MRGGSGWSSFTKREVKYIVDWLLRIVYEESLVSDIVRASVMEIGYKSRWWSRYNHVCVKFGLWELVHFLWLRNINKEGIAIHGINFARNVWKKTFVDRIQEYGRIWWRNGLVMNERGQQYVQVKSRTKKREICKWMCESESDIMLRGICLPVIGSKGMEIR